MRNVALDSIKIIESNEVTVALEVLRSPVRLDDRVSKPDRMRERSESFMFKRTQVTKLDFKYCAIVNSSGGKSPGGSEEQERGNSSVWLMGDCGIKLPFSCH